MLEGTKRKLKEIYQGTNTIRFRMTFIYSGLLFIFSALIVLVLNFYMAAYLPDQPPAPRAQDYPSIEEISGPIPDDILLKYEEDLQRREDERVRASRMEDIDQFLEISIISLFPMAILSFMVGYYVSKQFLRPLHELDMKIKKIKVDGLGTEIDKETDDEIGNLIDSFNDMSKRLDYAFKTQEEFVQDAAHELKTPLSVITINLDSILDDKNATKEELHTAISNTLNSIAKINSLTESLLHLSLPSHQGESKEDIKEIIEEQIELLKPFAKKENTNIIFSYPEEELLIKCDRMNLGRAVFNLIENAIKYSQKSNEDHKSKVDISLSSKKKFIKIKITDNGEGIPKEHQERIFDRFYRIDKSRNRKYGGFGLGLPIVKKIAEDHDGKISLKSKPGKTVMTILLPNS